MDHDSIPFTRQLVAVRYGKIVAEQIAYTAPTPVSVPRTSLAFASVPDACSWIARTVLRKEEVDGPFDRWGGYEHAHAELVKNNLDQEPIVDCVVDALVRRQFPDARFARWPKGAAAAVCFSHDVDAFSGFSHFGLRQLFWATQGKYATIRRWRSWRRSGFDPLVAFERWLDLEQSHGVKSTFFFLSLRRGLSREGRLYSVRAPEEKRILRMLVDHGWPIGLHAAYYRNLSQAYLVEQRERLEDAAGIQVNGTRHHYLRSRFPESWSLYTEAGFSYSSNLAWGRGHQGFRGGTSVPFFPIVNGKRLPLVEIPFQLMDSSSYTEKQEHAAIGQFTHYLQAAKRVGGCVVINFHSQYFEEQVAPRVNAVYRAILKNVTSDPDVYVTTCDDLARRLQDSPERPS